MPLAILGAIIGTLLRGLRQQHLHPDRLRAADRHVGQERDSHHRVRQAAAGRNGKVDHRRSPRGRQAPLPPDPDDRSVIPAWRGPPGDRIGCRCQQSGQSRYSSLRRHVPGHRGRRLHDSVALRGRADRGREDESQEGRADTTTDADAANTGVGLALWVEAPGDPSPPSRPGTWVLGPEQMTIFSWRSVRVVRRGTAAAL